MAEKYLIVMTTVLVATQIIRVTQKYNTACEAEQDD